MPRHKHSGAPNAQKLITNAASQMGHFTLSQAIEAGYSRQLLGYYLQSKKITRIARGIFLFDGIKPIPHSALAPFWLWSEQTGVFSHDSALFLLGLRAAPPETQRMILPLHRKKRRLQIPEGLSVSYEVLRPEHRQQIGPFLTTPKERTLADCTLAGIPLDPPPQVKGHAPHDPAPPTPSRPKTIDEEFIDDLNRILAEVGANHRIPPGGGKPVFLTPTDDE
jgi:hypothetical protein